MTATTFSEKAGAYLQCLCVEIPSRRVGSPGNRAATEFFSAQVKALGFDTDVLAFNCLDWRQEGAQLMVHGAQVEAFVSPYSPGCQVQAPLVVLSSVAELEAAEGGDAIFLLRGDLCNEPLMPKHFPFYNPEAHQRIIRLLEAKAPRAIVAATSQSPESAGALYPFPLIEDGDFDIPSVYMTEVDGKRLAEHAGEAIALDVWAWRTPARGYNVIARKGGGSRRRVVVFAHIDAKDGTPGAVDNGSGVVVLLLLAELLASYSGDLGVEIVPLNGEDHYAVPGQKQYLQLNAGKFEEVVLGINVDGAGYHRGSTAYSLYGCPPSVAGLAREVFSARDDIVEGEPWVQGDHSLFILHERPALAVTSAHAAQILAEIAHTSADRPEIVAVDKLVDLAMALRELISKLDSNWSRLPAHTRH